MMTVVFYSFDECCNVFYAWISILPHHQKQDFRGWKVIEMASRSSVWHHQGNWRAPDNIWRPVQNRISVNQATSHWGNMMEGDELISRSCLATGTAWDHTTKISLYFFQGVYLKPFSMAMALMFFQQFSGINAVIFYLQNIWLFVNSISNSNKAQYVMCFINFFNSHA